MASRLLKAPRTKHPPAKSGSVQLGHIIVVAKPLKGISHEDNGVDLGTLRKGSRVRVLDMATNLVPTALCMSEDNDKRWPWVISQIEYFVSKGKLVLTRDNG